MSKDLKERFYSEQVPELLQLLQRIADALERQVELTADRRQVESDRVQSPPAAPDGERELRRQRFKEQLEKLAEVDRMARELRRKLEEKQVEEAAAQARLQDAASTGDAAKIAEEDAGDRSEDPPIPTNN